MKTPPLSAILLGLLCAALAAQAAERATDRQLAAYQAAGSGPADPARGARLWQQPFPSADGASRRCSDCHGSDLRQPGRHAKTGKAIEPLAPSVSAESLTDPAKIEKWFRRNCSWTLGRECTPQEKADLLSYINLQ